ncbi:DUF2203 domain-containing protein [soil metagenome]|jgi:hypothetical protein|nr:DUF2203 domain-containing protein [Acidobacteriota bacterium]
MKLFTIKEANALLPVIRPKLEKIKARYKAVSSFREPAKTAAKAAQFGGGGMEGGTHYVKSLYEIGKLTTEFHKLGVQLKDYSRGLVDFPSVREGRVVLLCWQLGEGDEIQWWHDEESGFAGRQSL